jgi:hypothetical protein
MSNIIKKSGAVSKVVFAGITVVLIIALITLGFIMSTRIDSLQSQVSSLQSINSPLQYPSSPSYTIWKDGNNYFVKDAYSALAFGGGNPDASYLINLAISSLPPNGGTILLLGTIVLNSTVYVNRNSVEITGENNAGDAFFVRDGTYHGVSNKSATTVIAEDITAFNVGTTDLVFGISFKNFIISGSTSDGALPLNIYSTGCGINLTRCDTVSITNLEVVGKYYGIYMSASGGTYNVIDLVTLESLRLVYNVYGIFSQSWVANVHANNIMGYINQRGLLHVEPQYDWSISNVWSNADSWKSEALLDTPIYIGTSRDIAINNIVVAGGLGEDICPVPLITLACSTAGSPEWARAHISLSYLTLSSTKLDAIRVVGSGGQVDIENLYAGTNGTQDYYGASGKIQGSIVTNENGAGIIVNVNKGFVNSAQLYPPQNWFVNCSSVRDIENFNPVGNIRPEYAFNNALGWFGLQGNDAVSPSTTYTVHGVPVYLNSTSGLGVSITVYSPDGIIFLSNLPTISQYLPIGWKINFGAFSVKPTLIVIGD